MAFNTPSFRKSVGSVAMQSTYNTIVYDYYPLVSIADRPIFWDARYAQEWASGKVAYEHNRLLSSGIGAKVVEIMNKKILGSNLIFKKGKDTRTAKKTVDFIRKKCSELGLDEVTETANIKRLAGGSSYFVLNPTSKGDLILDAIGIDQAYVTFKGRKPVRARIFINYIDDNSTASISACRYYLVEERYFKDGKPYTINKIYQSVIPQNEGAYSSFTYGWRDDESTKSNDVTEAFINGTQYVSDKVLNEIKNSGIIFNYEFELPFKGLGVVHCKNTSTSTKHPNSKYGDPLLIKCFDLMWVYDFAFSILSKDLYTGRAITFIPDTLNGNLLAKNQMTDEEFANAFYTGTMELPALFDDEFAKIPNFDMEWQTPTAVQHDIRSEKIKTAMDTIATNIAQCVGLDPSFLISQLNMTNETKTAFEVNNEASVSNVTLLRKRQLLQVALNEVIDELCHFYGVSSEDVSVCFPPLEELNQTLMADYIVKLRSVQGMSTDMLVNLAYKDLTEAEKQEEIDKIRDEQESLNKLEDKNLNKIDNNLRDNKESEDVVDED